jgi:hypothetical protein
MNVAAATANHGQLEICKLKNLPFGLLGNDILDSLNFDLCAFHDVLLGVYLSTKHLSEMNVAVTTANEREFKLNQFADLHFDKIDFEVLNSVDFDDCKFHVLSFP